MEKSKYLELISENSKDMVVVANPATEKIYYINQAVKDFLGNPTDEQWQNTPCYKLFKHYARRCGHCPAFLKNGQRSSRKDFYFPYSEKYLSAKIQAYDIDDETICISVISDMTNNKKLEMAEMEKEESSKLLINCMSALYPTKSFEETINEVLKQTANFYQGERSYLVLYDKDNKENKAVYEYLEPPYESRKEILTTVPFDMVERWSKKTDENDSVILKSVNKEISEQSEEYDY